MPDKWQSTQQLIARKDTRERSHVSGSRLQSQVVDQVHDSSHISTRRHVLDPQFCEVMYLIDNFATLFLYYFLTYHIFVIIL